MLNESRAHVIQSAKLECRPLLLLNPVVAVSLEVCHHMFMLHVLLAGGVLVMNCEMFCLPVYAVNDTYGEESTDDV